MGITIHFSGRLKSAGSYMTVTGLGREFAHRKGSVVLELDTARKELIRFKGGEIIRYVTPVRGIQFWPDPQSEPVLLQFDKDDYLQHSCKTQYAGAAVHLEVLGFLREIEPYFDDFNVVDEAGFWDTGDVKALEENFGRMNTALGLLGNALSQLEDPPDPDRE